LGTSYHGLAPEDWLLLGSLIVLDKKLYFVALFDKNLLFDGKSIKQEKARGKEINRAEGKETEGVF
jgi:hypothetical protein